MTNMMEVIEPKSDQLNADDLVVGTKVLKITSVKIAPSGQQRVSIFFEGDKGKPYKPCKTMCWLIVLLWGADVKKYIGGYLEVYRDPQVTWGGLAVGGIRISRMSSLEADSVVVPLTVSKGKKKMHKVELYKPESHPQMEVLKEKDKRNLIEEARQAAAQGIVAYKHFWSELTVEGRKVLQPNHEDLKRVAMNTHSVDETDF